MKTTASESYFVTEVMTATPQKLQLMLIDAAIRFAERASIHWQANEDETAFHCLIRSQQIVGEMLSSLDYEEDSDFVRNVAGVYLFIFRALMEASGNRDGKKLAEALRVLNVERETWRQVCEKIGGKVTEEQAKFTPSASKSPLPAPTFDSFDDLPMTGFSLEA